MEQIWVLLLISIIKKDILVLGKGPTQGLEYTLTAEKMYSINFTVNRKVFRLSLHYNWAKGYLYNKGKEINGVNGYVYEFSVAFDLFLGEINEAISTFHNYFIFKYGIK